MMELTYLELDGVRVQMPPHVQIADANQDVVARVSEMMERVENAEPGCIALATSASF